MEFRFYMFEPPPTYPSFALEESEPLVLLINGRMEGGVLRKYPSGKCYFKTAREAFIKPDAVAWAFDK
jgi:hypothetical protein